MATLLIRLHALSAFLSLGLLVFVICVLREKGLPWNLATLIICLILCIIASINILSYRICR